MLDLNFLAFLHQRAINRRPRLTTLQLQIVWDVKGHNNSNKVYLQDHTSTYSIATIYNYILRIRTKI